MLSTSRASDNQSRFVSSIATSRALLRPMRGLPSRKKYPALTFYSDGAARGPVAIQKRLGFLPRLARRSPPRDKPPVPRRAVLLVVTLCAACAARAPRLPYTGPLDDFLAAHPLADGQNIRVDEIGRTASASYHVAQVRGAESPHRHVTHDLTVVVLRGHGTLTRDGERVAVVAGDTSVIARGAPHWFANGARTPAVSLVIFVPPLDAPDTVPVDAR